MIYWYHLFKKLGGSMLLPCPTDTIARYYNHKTRKSCIKLEKNIQVANLSISSCPSVPASHLSNWSILKYFPFILGQSLSRKHMGILLTYYQIVWGFDGWHVCVVVTVQLVRCAHLTVQCLHTCVHLCCIFLGIKQKQNSWITLMLLVC